MMSQVIVRNKTRDPQAVTAHTTFTSRLGFAKTLSALQFSSIRFSNFSVCFRY